MVRQERCEELRQLWQQERVPIAELARWFTLHRKTVRRCLRDPACADHLAVCSPLSEFCFLAIPRSCGVTQTTSPANASRQTYPWRQVLGP